jgi:uncharacterized protein (DUF1697 family)
MAELRGHLGALGLQDVATFLASGNVVFDAPDDGRRDLAAVEEAIEAHLEEALGYDVGTLVRPLRDLGRIPRLDVVVDAIEGGFTPHVIFVKESVEPAMVAALGALEDGDDRFHALEREILWLRRGRMSDAPFSTRELETALGGVVNTMRNLNTVRRIVARFAPT